MKKAQGLPMTTIVIIVLVLLVLAAVSLVFIYGFIGPGAGTTAAASSAECQAYCLAVQQTAKGLTQVEVGTGCAGAEAKITGSKYCTEGCADSATDPYVGCTGVSSDNKQVTIG